MTRYYLIGADQAIQKPQELAPGHPLAVLQMVVSEG